MKHDMNFKHTGKCFVCGLDTKLPIHMECGKKMDAERNKTKKVRKHKKRHVDYLENIDT